MYVFLVEKLNIALPVIFNKWNNINCISVIFFFTITFTVVNTRKHQINRQGNHSQPYVCLLIVGLKPPKKGNNFFMQIQSGFLPGFNTKQI